MKMVVGYGWIVKALVAITLTLLARGYATDVDTYVSVGNKYP